MKPTPTIEQAKATPRKWHEAATGNHQGLILDEATGENIAVTYEKKYAALIVEAVNSYDQLKAQNQVLREALLRCITDLELAHGGRDTLTLTKARAALAQP